MDGAQGSNGLVGVCFGSTRGSLISWSLLQSRAVWTVASTDCLHGAKWYPCLAYTAAVFFTNLTQNLS